MLQGGSDDGRALCGAAGADRVKPAQVSFPEAAFLSGHDPLAFEKDGDIWMASKMYLASLTPNTAAYNDVASMVSEALMRSRH